MGRPVRGAAPDADFAGLSRLPAREAVTLVILAGGEGRRMGGVDKGLVEYRGKALIEHVIERVASQVGQILISANRSAEIYAGYGYPVLPDIRPGYCGPLAGIEAALAAVSTPWALVVPCDVPGLPADLLSRLAQGAASPDGSSCAAVALSEGRRHLVLLIPLAAHRDLPGQLLDAGEHRVQALLDALQAQSVSFDDVAETFANLNSIESLQR